MIWCDRAALLWAILLIAVILFAQQDGGFSASLSPENIVNGWLQILLRLVVVPWAALRFVDLITGGPARRSGRFVISRW